MTPTDSVKLAEAIKLRLNRLVASPGVTAHAVMMNAIESTLSNAENHSAFVAAAWRSRQQVVESGRVIDGVTFCDYLKARARGLKTARPKPLAISSLLAAPNNHCLLLEHL